MKIGLLVFDHVSPELVGLAGDYDTMFRRLLAGHTDVELLAYDVINGQIPSSPTECDGWLTTGSRHSVNDDFDWIHETEDFTRKTATVGIPFVGICFGHQLLAKAFGGTVARSARGWGVGVKTVHLAQGLSFIPADVESFRIVNSHRDQIQELPRDAVTVGWNDHCPVSAMTVGPSILGIQGHPEMEVAYAQSLIESRRGTSIPEQIADAAFASFSMKPDTTLIVDFIVDFLGDSHRHP